ncbi:MAG: electron transfer flavoprotein-ubiquinone oxidoreductase [Pseudomonadota bacterium]
MQRDVMNYDVLIVGAGPAGLAAAIRLKQLAAAAGKELSVCVLEKGAQVGAHILSGAVIDPIAINELLPDWRARGAPIVTAVSDDQFLLLSETGHFHIPHALVPPLMRNDGYYIVSLGKLCAWLGEQAEALGVEIYPGFAAAEVLYGDDGSVRGIVTGDMGVAKDGTPKAGYAPGMELHAKYTLIAEGARGSLAKQLRARYALGEGREVPKFGLGFKELWRVEPARHQPGKVIHTLGWPLDDRTGGGGFLYHLEGNRVAVGYVVHLDYANPYLSPFDEFQRFKTHPALRDVFSNGERLSYGARAITEGGLQSIPKLSFPGGALIGCSAGFVNLPRIKGSHNAMKTGMLAAEAAFQAICVEGRHGDELSAYATAVAVSWVYKDLDAARNVKSALSRWGLRGGMLYAGVELWLRRFGGRLPWTLRHGKADHESLAPAGSRQPINYPKPDGVVSFDRLSSVYLAGLSHDEDQPVHLKLARPELAIEHNLKIYDAPEQRYCPAGVYEIIRPTNERPRLQINAANCVHCKACDIKDPLQNITWVTPEGGSGPNYVEM